MDPMSSSPTSTTPAPPIAAATSLGAVSLTVSDLARGRAFYETALARLAEAGWSLDGVADHLVSEALYLSDPDGNGIELYRDRPREEWRYDAGQLQMATLPLDLRSLAEAHAAAVPRGEPAAPPRPPPAP